MERKIGEIFEYNGEWYQCVKGDCTKCDFFIKRGCVSPLNTVCGKRMSSSRNLKRSENLMNLMGIYFNHTIHLKYLYSQKIMRLLEN